MMGAVGPRKLKPVFFFQKVRSGWKKRRYRRPVATKKPTMTTMA